MNPPKLKMISARPPEPILNGVPWRSDTEDEAESRSKPTSLEGPAANSRFGKYTMLDYLGQGVSSIVYRAQRHKDGQHVALKLMKHTTEELECLARQEFDMLRSIENPSIIKAYDFMPAARFGDVAIVLELFQGKDLQTALESSGRLPADTALRLFMQLLEAVAYLHSKGIIHRDIKAENVLVDCDFFRLKLVDFNVATWLAKGCMTPTGTPTYFSPEVHYGEPPDEAQDVWAAGLCLRLMLCGQLGFDHDAAEVPADNCRPEDRQWLEAKCGPEDLQVTTEGICHVALSKSLQYHKHLRATAPALLEDLRRRLVLID